MKTISVIVPVYNGEKYIDNCLNSILKQTLEDIEVICVNDGSTDSSSEILHRFAKADDRIKVIDKKNQGAGAARNDGIRSSEAKYIAFMDADDLYPGNSVLKTLYETAENNNADICGGYICSNGNLDGDAFRKFSREGFFPVKEEQIDYGFSRFIYKRACLLENNVFFPERSVFEDPVFLVKALHAAGKYYAVNECTYIYTESHHKDLNAGQTLSYLEGLKEMLQFTEANHYDDLYKKNFGRLEKEGQYFAEKNYPEKPKEIFCRLVELNGVIRKDLLDLPEDYVLPALITINNMACKYEKIRNNALFSFLRKVRKTYGKK